MDSVAASETVLVALLCVTIMGAWDGVVRHHIRISVDVLQLHVKIRGIGAIVVGLFCGALGFLLAGVCVSQLARAYADCHGRFTCAMDTTIVPAFTHWQTVLGLIVFGFLFVQWLVGATDLRGPYRRYLLAPGVWYSERDIVQTVSQRLQAAHLKPIPDDTILNIASLIRADVPVMVARARDEVTRDGALDVQALVSAHSHLSELANHNISQKAQRIVLEAIVGYYVEKQEAAARVWPWRRRFLGR